MATKKKEKIVVATCHECGATWEISEEGQKFNKEMYLAGWRYRDVPPSCIIVAVCPEHAKEGDW